MSEDWIKNAVKDKYGNPEISLCKNCWCMTHTMVGNVCGKCKKPKHIIDVIGDENIGGESRGLKGKAKADKFIKKVVESGYDETLRRLGK